MLLNTNMLKKMDKYTIDESKILYPPYHTGKYLEQYFIDFYLKRKEEFDETGYIFLPICWTDIYNHRPDLKNTLQKDLNDLDKNQKYFVVCQHSNAPAESLPPETIKFAAGGSRKNCIPIPLICGPVPILDCTKKDIFCSFVGSAVTHEVRKKMVNFLSDLPEYIIHSKEQWSYKITNEQMDSFLDITAKSKFCLSPRGTGPTSFRLYEAMQLESIPVYVYTTVPYLPFRDVINWEDICILIEENDISNINNILKSVSEDQYICMKTKIKSIYSSYFTLEAVCEKILSYLKGDPTILEKNTLRWKHYNK